MGEFKLVAFTFDDGPLKEYSEDSSAMSILRTLEKYGQKATCFYVGQQINEGNQPEMDFAQKIGVEVGNHSFTHRHLMECTAEEIKEEYSKTDAAVEAAIGKKPKLARIPYLSADEKIKEAVDYPMISCAFDSKDWSDISTEEIIERIMMAEKAGELENGVILMHEQYYTTARAVEYLIPTLMEMGYRFVTVSELAKINGIALENHKIYGKIQKEEAVRRKNLGAKTYCYPMPVFIIGSYDENGTPDAMNAAWGGISEEEQISICLSPEHRTVKNILARKAFTVSMAEVSQVVACDYVGIVSGNDVPEKLIRAGFHTIKSEFVDAPIIKELRMTLECEMISYDEESCRMVGKIVNISADESVLDENGKIDPKKLQPIVYDGANHTYLVLGEVVGKAFSDGTKLK
ncbi:MAG: polysaccharide deacetylase family protein [Lachnospiraceae bacterium]|nr:polysaccharide deacetylase family protein [Lachnospiraceae bacterium]